MFHRHRAYGFPKCVLQEAYNSEKECFKRTMSVITRSSVPGSASFVCSHVLYKIENKENNPPKLEAGIAPHRNEDSVKRELRSDCSMCGTLDVKNAISISTIRKWHLSRVDVKSSFLQTGATERSVHFFPPRESRGSFRYLWLSMVAS